MRASALCPSHQLELHAETQAALARKRSGFEPGALGVASAGETDPDLMAAEHGMVGLRRRMFLIEDLALPSTAFGGVGTEIIEECVAAEDSAFVEDHHPSQAAIDAVEHFEPKGIEP